ncbi:MAG: CHASE4 domain-containing protein [Methanoregula sp.]
MRLQKKTFLVISGLLVAVILVVSIFYSTIILASYGALEEQYIAQDLDQAVNKINDELTTMSNIASDWGPWDDTVEFVHGNDPNYLHSNLQPYGFGNLDLNLIVITNTKGNVIFSGSYDLQNQTMVPVPAAFAGPLDLKNPLMNMSDPHHVTSGILMLPEAPLLVVSQPVMYSNFSGQPHGVVIMGRYLNREEIARLGELTRPSLTFTRIEDTGISASLLSRIRETPSGPGLIEPQNGDLIAGYSAIKDIYGNDALILGITESRDIYHQGITTTLQVILIILAAGLFIGLGVIFLLDRAVLSRLRSLADQVNTIGKSGTSKSHVEIAGDDELSGLAKEIDHMLGTLEKTHDGLMQSEARFRELADLLPQTVFEMDLRRDLLYANHAGQKLFGIDDEKIKKGVNVRNYLLSEEHDQMLEGLALTVNGTQFSGKTYSLKKVDGTLMIAIVYTSPIQRSGVLTGFRGIIIDITERKKAEDALRLANRQLSLLTSITRHDINNQMTALRGLTSLLEMKQPNPAFAEYFRKINSALDRITTLIEFTQEFESIGTHAPVWQDCRTLVDTAKTQVPIGKIMLENSIPAGFEIYADPLIVKVFYNLIDNAIRHGGRITTIQFFLQQSGNDYLIICEDDGDGIPSDDKLRIFERGFGRNTGLGLFLAQEILNITGIIIRENGIPGKGARFEIVVSKENWRFL